MGELVKMVVKGIIWLFSALLFGFPLVVFSIVDRIIDMFVGESRDIDMRLNYWKPFERRG